METRKFMEKLFSHYCKNEMKEFFSYFDEHTIWNIHGNHPLAGEYKTIANLENAYYQLNQFYEGTPEQRLRHLVCENHKACAFLYDEITGRDGKKYQIEYWLLLEMSKDGKKVIWVDNFLDTEQLMRVMHSGKSTRKTA